MADAEWPWSSARSGGDASAPATESATSSASSSAFLADPYCMDWTEALMDGKVAAEEATSFDAQLQLQLQGEAASHHHFLLDQAAPLFPVTSYADGTAVAVPSSQGVSSLYADNHHYCTSYSDVQAAATMSPFSSQQQQLQLSGFFSSSGFFGPGPASPQLLSQALEPKPLESKTEPVQVQDACSSPALRRSAPPDSPAAVKKPRIETPSPLPTFKVRKEKLGDRITALQQLVSPFGKTDAASVLHEAIEYIRFLHGQVASLSSPYLRCGGPMQLEHQQGTDKLKDRGDAKEDLSSRGLCLVPVASTYTVASETAPEFWHPTFGDTFR